MGANDGVFEGAAVGVSVVVGVSAGRLGPEGACVGSHEGPSLGATEGDGLGLLLG